MARYRIRPLHDTRFEFDLDIPLTGHYTGTSFQRSTEPALLAKYPLAEAVLAVDGVVSAGVSGYQITVRYAPLFNRDAVVAGVRTAVQNFLQLDELVEAAPDTVADNPAVVVTETEPSAPDGNNP